MHIIPKIKQYFGKDTLYNCILSFYWNLSNPNPSFNNSTGKMWQRENKGKGKTFFV